MDLLKLKIIYCESKWAYSKSYLPDFEDFELRKITPIKALKAFDESRKNSEQAEVIEAQKASDNALKNNRQTGEIEAFEVIDAKAKSFEQEDANATSEVFNESTKNGGEIEIYDLAAEDVSNDAAFATLLWCGLESRLKCSGGGFSDIHTEYKADKSYFGKMMLDQKTFYFSLSVKNAE